MSRVRQSATPPELKVRKILHARGCRFRVKAKGLPGTPDIVNRSAKWAVFVHGCFWHAHEGCYRWKIPKNNREFWVEKFNANRERDKRKTRELEQLGFSVLVVWQCELERERQVEKKLLRFMKKVESKNKGRINGKVSVNDIGFALPLGPRGSYHFSSSGKYVSRVVEFPRGSKTVSKLSNDCRHASPDGPESDFDWLYLRLKHRSWRESTARSIRCVDLFSGCGGLSLGANEACLASGLDFEPILALDNDASALAVYIRNFSPIRAHNCDIEHIVNGKNGGRITAAERELLNEIKTVDLLLAGPPCQGHSDLNNHTRRKDKRNTLYERVGRFAEIMEPESILIENVPTIIHSHDRVLFETIELLQRRGYQVDSGIVDLSEVGVPQKRKRHVLVASFDNYVKIEEVVEKYRVSHPRTVRWAIEDLEQEKSNGVFTSPSRHTADNLERIDYLFANRLYDLPDAMRPPCHRNGHSYKSMYGRMRYDEPAQTITSGYGCPGQGRFIHPTQRRALTPHEAARLQFFPDFFDFSSVEKRTALANMIGNAVPMKLSYIFTLELLG